MPHTRMRNQRGYPAGGDRTPNSKFSMVPIRAAFACGCTDHSGEMNPHSPGTANAEIGHDRRKTEDLSGLVTLQQALPFAQRAANIHAALATASRRLLPADREDIQQEAMAACWRALPRFDPSRASLATFTECIIRRRVCSLVRTASRRPQTHPLNAARYCAVYLDARR